MKIEEVHVFTTEDSVTVFPDCIWISCKTPRGIPAAIWVSAIIANLRLS